MLGREEERVIVFVELLLNAIICIPPRYFFVFDDFFLSLPNQIRIFLFKLQTFKINKQIKNLKE